MAGLQGLQGLSNSLLETSRPARRRTGIPADSDYNLPLKIQRDLSQWPAITSMVSEIWV
jgi:hypothetical protein